ncbi:MAG: oligoendopeptidase F [Ruminococcaceae bacterium]|nr:oligoendopeptidase F [Oscillospiraceae bacterium]
MELKNRSELSPEFQWDCSHIFPSYEAWEDAFAKVTAEIPTLAELRGTLGESARSLAAGLDRLYAVSEHADLVALYAFLHHAADGGDTRNQEMMMRVQLVGVELGKAVAFVDPELLEIPEEKLNEFLKNDCLTTYRHYIDDVTRQRAHTLDAKSEELLAAVSKIAGTPRQTYDAFTNVDLVFPTIKGEDGEDVGLTSGNFGVFRESADRRVREDAFNAMFGTYGKYINTFASLYSGSVKQDNMLAELRGYESACHAALGANNVPTAVYDALVDAVHDAIPTMTKYLNLRKEAMGLDKIDVFDLYTPMVAEVDYPMPYADACELVKAAVAPLGEKYVSLIERAYKEKWIDVYENKGKTSGAFSCGVYGVHPYVLLNYTDALDDAFTLAHELGHAMHSYLSSEKQDYANHDYRILVAEVASTCNEVLLTKYLLSIEKDKKRRAYILNHFLEGFRTTVFRQTLFAEFERKAHDMEAAGTPLTADALNELYASLVKQYYAGAEMQDVVAYEWAYIPHFYRNFYVYQYATGFSSAVAIASHILETGDASGYLEFLSTGGCDYPINELKLAGIDLTSPEVVRNAMKMFDETITELRECLAL